MKKTWEDKTWEDVTWQDIIKFKWFKRLYVLYIFGFILNFRPSAPFIYEFLTSYRKFMESDVNEHVFTTLFYSTAPQLLFVFLLVDFFCYNPFIILSCLTGIVSTCLYIWTSSLTNLEVAQAFYGSMAATEIAYYVCIYAHCDVIHYSRYTSYVRAAPLAGKAISSLLGQLLIWTNALDYKQLYYFDLSALILATLVSIFIPPIEKETSEKKPGNFSQIVSNFGRSFPNKYIVKWSIWSILTICGYNQICIYIQFLWKNEQTENGSYVYNGSVEGIFALFALIGTVLGGFATFNWKYKGDLILSFTSLVQFFAIMFVSLVDDNVLKYFFYTTFGFMFHFITTILSGEIAKFLNKGCFGLVFGFIALIATILSCLMVYVLNDKRDLFQHPQNDTIYLFEDPQYLFMAYGYYHLSIAILFISVGLSYWLAKHTYA